MFQRELVHWREISELREGFSNWEKRRYDSIKEDQL